MPPRRRKLNFDEPVNSNFHLQHTDTYKTLRTVSKQSRFELIFSRKIKPYFYNSRSESIWPCRMSQCLGELAMERKTKHCQKIIITVQFVWNGWYKIQSIIFVYKATFRNSYLGTSSSIIGFQTFCWSCRRWRQFYCSLKVWKFPPTKSCHHTLMTS